MAAETQAPARPPRVRRARPPAPGRPGQRTPRRRRIATHVAIALLSLLMVYPLLWMLASSFKPTSDIFSQPGLIPHRWQPSNYVEGWRGIGTSFLVFFENSIFLSVASVIGNVVSCSLAAYAFARLEFSFRRTAFALMLGTLMLPAHVTLIPQYIVFNHLHLVNTFYPIFARHFFAVDAFFVFLMVQFIRGIPRDLDEAARIDGCGPGRIFLYIVFPLLRPALVTTVIFTFIWTYNDFFTQLIYLNDNELFTVPEGLRLFLDSTGESSWGPMLAMSTLALVPALALFVTFQRLIVDGIATTGVKG